MLIRQNKTARGRIERGKKSVLGHNVRASQQI